MKETKKWFRSLYNSFYWLQFYEQKRWEKKENTFILWRPRQDGYFSGRERHESISWRILWEGQLLDFLERFWNVPVCSIPQKNDEDQESSQRPKIISLKIPPWRSIIFLCVWRGTRTHKPPTIIGCFSNQSWKEQQKWALHHKMCKDSSQARSDWEIKGTLREVEISEKKKWKV